MLKFSHPYVVYYNVDYKYCQRLSFQCGNPRWFDTDVAILQRSKCSSPKRKASATLTFAVEESMWLPIRAVVKQTVKCWRVVGRQVELELSTHLLMWSRWKRAAVATRPGLRQWQWLRLPPSLNSSLKVLWRTACQPPTSALLEVTRFIFPLPALLPSQLLYSSYTPLSFLCSWEPTDIFHCWQRISLTMYGVVVPRRCCCCVYSSAT